jgi:hypothetical protein
VTYSGSTLALTPGTTSLVPGAGASTEPLLMCHDPKAQRLYVVDFFLGTHQSGWLNSTPVPLFISDPPGSVRRSVGLSPALFCCFCAQRFRPRGDEVPNGRIPWPDVVHEGRKDQCPEITVRRRKRPRQEFQATINKFVIPSAVSVENEVREIPEQHVLQELPVVGEMYHHVLVELGNLSDELISDALIRQRRRHNCILHHAANAPYGGDTR